MGLKEEALSDDEELTAQDGVIAKLTARDVRDMGGCSTHGSPSVPICVKGTKDHTKNTEWYQ